MRKKRNPAAIAGWCIILAFCLIAIFADFIAPYDPSELGTAYLKPSAEHLLGTNDLGQDIFSEMVYGTRVSLLLGVFSALLVSLVGTALALIAGYFGGKADKIICAVIDVAMAVPSLPLTMLLIAYLKSGTFSLILAISITAWTGTARILRTRVKQICELPYIKIEKAMGVSAGAELLLFDEPTKGLDEARIRLVADALNELNGQTMVCVTHDLSFARAVANRIGVMYAANLVEVADADELYAHPLHPYTRDMLAAMPENGLHFRPSYAPAHDDTRVNGCKYRMRCPNCSEKCAEMPPMADVDGHKVRCWQYV